MTSKTLISTNTEERMFELSTELKEAYFNEDLTTEELLKLRDFCKSLIKQITEDIDIFSTDFTKELKDEL